MDVYGYNQWQYNNSDELAKQMFTQKALSGNMPYKISDAPHVMPPPSGTPWNVQGVSWGMASPQPDLVQFTAPNSVNMPQVSKRVLTCKRKPVDVESVIPTKQLITEEKMAAHLNSLHISSNYTKHSLASEECMDIVPVGQESTPTLTERLEGRTIVLSEELKKLRNEPIIPGALLERLEKPCMSLMVWKPKENILEIKKEKLEEKENSISSDDSKRKGVLVLDIGNTSMDVEM